MMKPYIRSKKISLLLLLSLLLYYSYGEAIEIKGPEIQFSKDDILVSFQFDIGMEKLNEIREGIPKEIIFYIDIFRYWKILPDEFIDGKKIVRTIQSNLIKGEFVASSFDGETLLEKRFMSFESMVQWALNFKDIHLTNMKTFTSGDYYVRVTVESRLRKIPSVISELFFFLPTKDFKIFQKSKLFTREVYKQTNQQ